MGFYMKFKVLWFVFSSLFLVSTSYAGESLKTACNDYGGTLLTNVNIVNYNANSIKSRFSIKLSNSSFYWFSIANDNKSIPYLYDIAKTARLTGERVDVCYNINGTYLLGIQWTKNLSQ